MTTNLPEIKAQLRRVGTILDSAAREVLRRRADAANAGAMAIGNVDCCGPSPIEPPPELTALLGKVDDLGQFAGPAMSGPLQELAADVDEWVRDAQLDLRGVTADRDRYAERLDAEIDRRRVADERVDQMEQLVVDADEAIDTALALIDTALEQHEYIALLEGRLLDQNRSTAGVRSTKKVLSRLRAKAKEAAANTPIPTKWTFTAATVEIMVGLPDVGQRTVIIGDGAPRVKPADD